MAATPWFDDMAKRLARAHSRRDLLRSIAGAIGGTLVAALPRDARAESECVEACRALGLRGHEFGVCMSECSRGTPTLVVCGDPGTQYFDVCGAGEFCCNESCGICQPLGGSCIQIDCQP